MHTPQYPSMKQFSLKNGRNEAKEKKTEIFFREFPWSEMLETCNQFQTMAENLAPAPNDRRWDWTEYFETAEDAIYCDD